MIVAKGGGLMIERECDQHDPETPAMSSKGRRSRNTGGVGPGCRIELTIINVRPLPIGTVFRSAETAPSV
jgi:hypothetical protein